MKRVLRNSFQYQMLDRLHVMHPYTSMIDPLPTYGVRSAQGVHLELEDGKKLIDGMSSWWACVHGYRHPVLDKAIREQLDKMAHVMFGGITHKPATDLCKLLVDISPEGMNKVFLADSGSVAVEVAMKMAVQYWFTIGDVKKHKFITIRNGYHGDTFGAMSVCDPVNGMHGMFNGVLAHQIFENCPKGPTEEDAMESVQEIEKTMENHSDEIAALIVEPIVQGAGGMRFYSPLFLENMRKLCDKYNILLIYDEIATGFGRTGTLFACEQTNETFKPYYSGVGKIESPTKIEYGPIPDIMCLGKALTGGYMTMGATLANDKVCQGISSQGGVFMHGPTFMGNPLASAVSLASVNLLLNSPWKEKAKVVQEQLIQAMEPLSQLSSVHQVRVLGGIGVCELKEPVQDMAATQEAFVQQGVWLRPFGKLIYTMPPFLSPHMEEEHIQKIGQAMYTVVSKF